MKPYRLQKSKGLELYAAAMTKCSEEQTQSTDGAETAYKINAFLNTILTSREQEILNLRMGFKDGRRYTFKSIGELYQVSQSRIEALQSQAVHKIERNAEGIEALLE